MLYNTSTLSQYTFFQSKTGFGALTDSYSYFSGTLDLTFFNLVTKLLLWTQIPFFRNVDPPIALTKRLIHNFVSAV